MPKKVLVAFPSSRAFCPFLDILLPAMAIAAIATTAPAATPANPINGPTAPVAAFVNAEPALVRPLLKRPVPFVNTLLELDNFLPKPVRFLPIEANLLLKFTAAGLAAIVAVAAPPPYF